jgi:hypothetical protein
MKIEIKDPKYKIGDLISFRLGENGTEPAVFCVWRIKYSGQWTYDGISTVNCVGPIYSNIYTLVAQEDIATSNGRWQIHKRMVLEFTIECVEENSDLVEKWDTPILKPVNSDYY